MASKVIVKLRAATDPEDQWRQLVPDSRQEGVRENVSIYLRLEGPCAEHIGRQHFECLGMIVREDAARMDFRWDPFVEGEKVAPGKIGFGFLRLHLRHPKIPPSERDYYVKILPQRLSLELWQVMFDNVCHVADALITQAYAPANPRLVGKHLPARTRFSPATALAEIAGDWYRLERSLRHIARDPRSEFRIPTPGRPGTGSGEGLPEPRRNADVYENALVVLTAQRVAATLRMIGRRARATCESAERNREFLKSARTEGAHMSAEVEVTQARQIARDADHRAAVLERLVRRMPRVSTGARGSRVPHVTPRIRLDPDYYEVLRWWRSFGHQRLALSGEEFLSVLAARRASDIYEYWSFFALCSAFVQLGYTPQFREFVREDHFELEIWRNRPFEFVRASNNDEVLSLWYEREARFLPKDPAQGKCFKLKDWPTYWRAPGLDHPPGLYAQPGPLKPDFWFELRCGGRLSVAVGDAIFSPGYDELDNRATEDVATRKAGKVNQYVKQLVLVDNHKQAHFPFEWGLVIYCGALEHIGIVEEACGSQVELLPLRPLGAARELISIEPEVLSRLGSYLEKLRQSAR